AIASTPIPTAPVRPASYAAHFTEVPELFRSEFRHPQYAPDGRVCVRGNDTGGRVADGSFQWSPAVRVLVAYLMRCAAWGRGDRAEPFPQLQGRRRTHAASLTFTIAKRPTWLCEMFGADLDGRPHIEALIQQSNRELRRSGEDVVLCLDHSPVGLP